MQTYDWASKSFMQWLGSSIIPPLTKQLVMAYLCDACDAGLSWDTVNKCRSWLLIHELIMTTEDTVMHSAYIERALRGYHSKARSWGAHGRTWPISRIQMDVVFSTPAPKLVLAASVIGYAFLLRWGEMVDVFTHLSSIQATPKGFILFLARSKADTRKEGVTVLFPYALFDDNLYAWVIWALAYIADNPFPPTSLAMSFFLHHLFGPQARFHGHRHGRASDLLAAGLLPASLRRLGRWASARAMHLYIHRISYNIVLGDLSDL